MPCSYVAFQTQPPGTNVYAFIETYKNGILRRSGNSLRKDLIIPDGLCTTYIEGKKFKDYYFQNGKIDSVAEFFPNGKLYQIMQYVYNAVSTQTQGNKPIEILIIKSCDTTGKVLVQNGYGHYLGYHPFDTETLEETGSFTDAKPGFDIIYNEGEMRAGRREGYWTGVSDDINKVIFKEKYKHGKLLNGESKDAGGQTYKYVSRTENPRFEGGDAALRRFLSFNLGYPANARNHGIKGFVYVSMHVAADGKVEAIKIARSPSNDLSAEAVRVLMLAPKWEPGRKYGHPIAMNLVLPVLFPYPKTLTTTTTISYIRQL